MEGPSQNAATASTSLRSPHATAIGTRRLRRGDLVRISESGIESSKRLKDRDGYLGRIAKVTAADDTSEQQQEEQYDVEWILGGKLLAVRRSDLRHTTADNEGMTEDGVTNRRGRNKRKPTDFMQEVIAQDESKMQARKKIVATTATAAAAVPKTPAPTKKAPPAKRPKAAKSKASKPKAKAAPKKRKLNEAPIAAVEPPAAAAAATTSVALVYERHRRELERIVTRLEKIDQFGFFFDPVPAELDEAYAARVEGATFDQAVTDAEQKSLHTAKSAVVQTTKSGPVFPSHAPFNWEMVRRRMEQDRYVVDREKMEKLNRLRQLGPYYASLGQRTLSDKLRRDKNEAGNPRVLHPKGVDWNLFRDDVLGMCDAAIARDDSGGTGASGSLTYAANKLKEALLQSFERTGLKQLTELSVADDRHKFAIALQKIHNAEAAVQGSWRREPFPERKYEKLSSDSVCAGLSVVDERIALHELKTNLPDSFIGLSYRYDDTGESEAWMKSLIDEAGPDSASKKKSKKDSQDNEERQAALALAADDGVTRAQVVATMQSLLIGVQDRVMTDQGVLEQSELRSSNWLSSCDSANTTSDSIDTDEEEKKASIDDSSAFSGESPEVVEQPVWGIDCYTRRNISTCLEADFDQETAILFIEKWLLPAINACPADLAPDLSNATRLLEGLPFQSPGNGEEDENTVPVELPTERYSHTLLGSALMQKIATCAPPWLIAASSQVRRARTALGPDFFRVHPKGHGSVLLCSRVKAGKLVTFYRGEVYPSWRWGEKMDAIDITQRRKELKPALPDFYNMALERPQTDPRGYGLLFVDASRKAGHGSSLSHSCAPSCEVRVAALNGELKLVMTTLRELEMGEELTFDYNAVTESLIEYSSAVCLCGNGKCRGSFLHFATADCYQQVLNRNAPIATRFANLVKGSMKQVMSEDDEKVLDSHGFLTAAFGAISVNRRKLASVGHRQVLLDSIDNVPVWLRTFVADVLRYIEYERRALPIALICDHLKSIKGKNEIDSPSRGAKEPNKPEPGFFFFSRTESDFLHKTLRQQGFPEAASDLQLRQATLKVASSIWNEFDEEKKQSFTQKSLVEFEKKKKAWQVAQRKNTKGSESLLESSSDDKQTGTKTKAGTDDTISASKISFEDADAEGVSAMEQRIQQLTQTLSRVGRVLDRHRETSFEIDEMSDLIPESVAATLRQKVHSPLAVLPDAEVVYWLWNKEDGVVLQLLGSVEAAKCVRPSLVQKLLKAKEEYAYLDSFPSNAQDVDPADAVKGRLMITEALLKLRSILLGELSAMSKEFRRYTKTLIRQESEREKDPVEALDEISDEQASDKELVDDEKVGKAGEPPINSSRAVHPVVLSLMNELIDEVEQRVLGSDSKSEELNVPSQDDITTPETQPWFEHYGHRYMLQAAADLLLLYARTGTFFVLKPYQSLTSSPVEVYAREIGNAVPRSAVDASREGSSAKSGNDPLSEQPPEANASSEPQEVIGSSGDKDKIPPSRQQDSKSGELCMPDDIVAEVSVKYEGDYVLSQLLQWYNGGIGLQPGLPDMLGCAVLPQMEGCWATGLRDKPRSKPGKKTTYESKVVPRLIEWLQDPHQRGNAWPDEIKKAFVANESNATSPSSKWIAFGSPVTDFLVTGDESSIFAVLDALDADDKAESKSSSGGLISSVDRGRPAQAVSNWVQCENHDCMKWRKIPWHVDVDLLPEKFFCSDNLWNSEANSCNSPEDGWDEADALVGADGKVEGSPVRKRKPKGTSVSTVDKASFRIGARFDVQRQGKSQFTTGTVTHVDFSGKIKRIKFHFVKTLAKHDDWIAFGSPRIASLYSKNPAPQKKKAEKKQAQANAATELTPNDISQSSKALASSDGAAEKKERVKDAKGKATKSKATSKKRKAEKNQAALASDLVKGMSVSDPSASTNSFKVPKKKKARVKETTSQTSKPNVRQDKKNGTSRLLPLTNGDVQGSGESGGTDNISEGPRVAAQPFSSTEERVPSKAPLDIEMASRPVNNAGTLVGTATVGNGNTARGARVAPFAFCGENGNLQSSSSFETRHPDFVTNGPPAVNTIDQLIREQLLRLATASNPTTQFATPFYQPGLQFRNGPPAGAGVPQGYTQTNFGGAGVPQGYTQTNFGGARPRVEPTSEELHFLQRAIAGLDPSLFSNTQNHNGKDF